MSMGALLAIPKKEEKQDEKNREPFTGSVKRDGFNIPGAEIDSDAIINDAKSDIRMRTIGEMGNEAKYSKKTKNEKISIQQGETKNKWRFNGPYDSPQGITDPGYLKIENMVLKREGDLEHGGKTDVHKSLWKRTHTSKGAPMVQQAYYSYNHGKQAWKKLNMEEKRRWTNKRSVNISQGKEMPGEINAYKNKTLADMMTKKRKRLEECGCNGRNIKKEMGVHKQM